MRVLGGRLPVGIRARDACGYRRRDATFDDAWSERGERFVRILGRVDVSNSSIGADGVDVGRKSSQGVARFTETTGEEFRTSTVVSTRRDSRLGG